MGSFIDKTDQLESFNLLFKQNYTKIFLTIYFYTNDRYIAEEAVQQAFIIAFKKINDLKNKDKFVSWVTSIAINEAKHLLKKQSEDKIISLTDIHQNLYSKDIEESVDIKNDVQNVLKQLKDQEAEILVLKYITDLPLRQICDLLGINISNAKIRLLRARKSFRSLIEETFNKEIGGGL